MKYISCWNKLVIEGLLKSMGQGNPAAADEFATRLVALLPRLRRYALSLCRHGVTAEDLVQNACLRVISARDTWEEGSNFDAWVFRILRNLWFDQLRHRKVAGTEEQVDEMYDLSSSNADSETQLFVAQVQKAMQDLPQDMREVVSLVCIEELSYREAAEILSVPVGTVMSRLARARIRLAEATGYKAE
jgi:RNA polymerase sigma-70 factor, ECF subfamily